MNGIVDEANRALLEIKVRKSQAAEESAVITWVDTAFDGPLVFSTELIQELDLDTLAETEAILADGTKVTLDCYLCFVEWFGEVLPVQVIENEGKYPLLGTGLLEGRVLTVDYQAKALALD